MLLQLFSPTKISSYWKFSLLWALRNKDQSEVNSVEAQNNYDLNNQASEGKSHISEAKIAFANQW